MKHIIKMISIILSVYLSFAFMKADLNIAHWLVGHRVAVVVISGIGLFVYVLTMPEEE